MTLDQTQPVTTVQTQPVAPNQFQLVVPEQTQPELQNQFQPMTPVTPVTPANPVVPVTPVTPVTLVTPVTPVTPATPVQPVTFRCDQTITYRDLDYLTAVDVMENENYLEETFDIDEIRFFSETRIPFNFHSQFQTFVKEQKACYKPHEAMDHWYHWCCCQRQLLHP